ncbi:hypothetical protein [Nostoc sp. UHCC 0251]|nr:hypothetical protein [Nostoc sp. UHCC 0251]MEA5623217.1 hypothetical protein [Nostoc sp. UHCC 0251]
MPLNLHVKLRNVAIAGLSMCRIECLYHRLSKDYERLAVQE